MPDCTDAQDGTPLTHGAAYTEGYLGALDDLSGPMSFERWQLVEQDPRGAAKRSFHNPRWIDEIFGAKPLLTFLLDRTAA